MKLFLHPSSALSLAVVLMACILLAGCDEPARQEQKTQSFQDKNCVLTGGICPGALAAASLAWTEEFDGEGREFQ